MRAIDDDILFLLGPALGKFALGKSPALGKLKTKRRVKLSPGTI